MIKENLEHIKEARLREAEVKERGETKLFSLEPERKEIIKPEIMVGARDMGAARTMTPVITELLHRHYPISLLADQPAEGFLREKFKNMKQVKIDSSLGAIAERQPGLILSTLSITGGPGIDFYLTKTAEGYGTKEVKRIPSIWIEDFWGVATRKEILSYPVKPDFVCAYDEYSKKINIDRGMSPEQIIVTGSPALDELAREKDRDEIRERVRGDLGIKKEETFITYIGDIPPEDFKNFRAFIDNLNKVKTDKDKKIKITTRIHPHVFTDKAMSQYRNEYEKIPDRFKNGEVVETMGKFSTDETAIAADILVSGFSTEGIKAIYRGKMSLFMFLPGVGADILKKSYRMENLPVVESGASIGVFQEREMLPALEKILDPEHQKEMRKAQQRYHNLDGQNTKRVVEVIEKSLINRSSDES